MFALEQYLFMIFVIFSGMSLRIGFNLFFTFTSFKSDALSTFATLSICFHRVDSVHFYNKSFY